MGVEEKNTEHDHSVCHEGILSNKYQQNAVRLWYELRND